MTDQLIHGRTGTYRLLERLGKGAYGVVMKGIELETGRQVATKRAVRWSLSKEEEAALQSEINLLQQLHHEHIVRYIEAVSSERYLDIIMEFVEGGSLDSLLKSWKRSIANAMGPPDRAFPEEMVVTYVRQTLLGLNYLHEQGIVHRDIKCANLLTTKDSVLKLADFGVSVISSGPNKNMSDDESDDDPISLAGSPYWMAPEVISLTASSTASDIWSLGCTVVELLTGSPPYFDLSAITAMFRIVNEECPPLPSDLTADAEDFLRRCFVKDISRRATASELLNHPWIKADLVDQEGTGNIGSSSSSTNAPRQVSEPRNLSVFQENPDEDIMDLFEPDEDLSFDIENVPVMSEERSGSSMRISNVNSTGPSSPLSGSVSLNSGLDAFSEIPPDNEADFERERLRHQKELWERVKLAVSSLGISELHDDACTALIDIFRRHPEQRYNVIHDPGLLPILEILEGEESTEDEIASVLEVLVAIVTGVEEEEQIEQHTALGYPIVSNVCEDICLAGFLPVIAMFCHRSFILDVRRESANIIEKMLEDERTLRMFVAGRGFRALVELLEPDYENFRCLADRALDGIERLLSMQNLRYKRDFCRRFAHCGLLERTVDGIWANVKLPCIAFSPDVDTEPISEDTEPASEDKEPISEKRDEELTPREIHLVKLSRLLMTFAARADPIVKDRMAQDEILVRIVHVLASGTLPVGARAALLACICDLSRDPGTHVALEDASTIEILTNILGEAGPQARNSIISTLHNLCSVSSARQERACTAGLVAHLMQLIRSEDIYLKSLCIDLYSGLATAGAIARKALWAHNGVDFYVEVFAMLSLPGTVRKWQARSLKSLTHWLESEGAARGPRAVESRLIQTHNIALIVESLVMLRFEDVEQILEPYFVMITISDALTAALSTMQLLMEAIIEWVSKIYSRGSGPRGRLLILQVLFRHVQYWNIDMKRWAACGLLPNLLKDVLETDDAVTVRQQASAIAETIGAP